jgi:hypothetical protein
MAKGERRTDLATFEEAQDLIFEIVNDSEWHSSREIHYELRKRLSDPMFGRVKKELGIEHHRVGGGHGSYFEWRMPPSRVRQYAARGAAPRDHRKVQPRRGGGRL